MNLKTSEKFKLFDSLVGSVLGYAGEVWGDTLVRNVYDCLYEDASDGRMYNGLNWAYQMKNMFDSLGFAYVWNNQALDNLTFQEIKQSYLIM